MKQRLWWYWQRCCMFCSLVWREWEPGYRISVRTAWDVAWIVWEPYHKQPKE